MWPLYSLLSLTSILTTLALAYTIGCGRLLSELPFYFKDKKLSPSLSYIGAFDGC